MSDELSKLQKDMEQGLREFRTVSAQIDKLEQQGRGVSELREKIEKADKAMEKYDAANQKMVEKMAQAQKAEKELNDRIDQLEAKSIKLSTAHTPDQALAIAAKSEMDALTTFSCKNMSQEETSRVGGVTMSNEELDTVKKYMRTDVNTDGGFLIDQAFDDMIIKPITEKDPVMSLAKIKRIDANSYVGALRDSLVESFWTGEGEDFEESKSTYKRPEIPVHSVTTRTLITNRMLLASRFSMDNEIMSDFRESFLKLTGAGFVTGDANKKPRGFLNHSGVQTVAAGSTTEVDYDALIDLSGALKDGYQGTFGLKRQMLTAIRKLQDGAGNYIFTTGDIKGGIPNQIAGDPYVLIPSMPDVAENATPIVYADWQMFYTVVLSWTAIMLRNPYKFDGKVQFSQEAWVGGDVVLPEAGALLKMEV